MISTLWFDRRAAAIRCGPDSLFGGCIGASEIIVPGIVRPGGACHLEQDPVMDHAAIMPDVGFEDPIFGRDGLHPRNGRPATGPDGGRAMAAKALGGTLQRVTIVIATFPLQVA
jgi:hypothetical protein